MLPCVTGYTRVTLPADQPQPRRNKNADFWRACRYLYPYRRIVIISVFCAFWVGFIMTGGLGAMLPILKVLTEDQTVQSWVDSQIRENLKITSIDESMLPAKWKLARQAASFVPDDPVKAIAVVFGFIAVLTVIGNTIRFFQEYLSDKASISAVMDIRRHLYDHVLHLPMSFFGQRGTSDVTSRLVQDSQGLQDGLKIVLGQFIQEPIKAAFAFGFSLYLSWKLTLFIVIFAPLMAGVIKKFGKKMRRASRAAFQKASDMLGQIESTLTGIRVVKGARAERFERRRYTGILRTLRVDMLKMARYEAYSTPAMETVSLLLVGVVLMFAAYLMFRAKGPDGQPALDRSTFFLVMACLVAIGESLRRVSKISAVLARSNSAAARIFEVLDLPVEKRRGSDRIAETAARNLLPLSRDIRFEGIAFGYPGSALNALDGISLTVPRGQSVAVVGRNGSGKTTLLALLPRFYDPQQGRILIDGIDIRNVTLRSLRAQIGIVTQEAVIFPGTIADNIAYGLPRAKRDEVIAAAKRAFAHDFIMEKPQGYDTVLGEMGGQLSGGQRQRINIARAILRKTPILILDEATSQVDAESEHLIQQAIESIMHERTTFVIAHRFSTILSADRIIVLDRGQIVGEGKHESLLAGCETYKQLYERQLVGT